MIRQILLLCTAFLLATPSLFAKSYSNTYEYQFADHSPLREGRWIKIKIAKTGVYEIPYSRLREMGFTDPSAVTLYGQPGYLRPGRFYNVNGVRQLEDNLEPVKILHANDKLIFYGEGTAKINFSFPGSDSSLHPQHQRESRSSYSDYAAYFLTDELPVETVGAIDRPESETPFTEETGYTYLYHELDSVQSQWNVGPLFWGETGRRDHPVNFRIEAPYCVAGKKAAMIADVVTTSNLASNTTFEITINDRTISKSLADKKPFVYTYTHSSSATRMIVNETTHIGVADVQFGVNKYYSDIFGIDYWSLSYPISLEYAKEDPNFTQIYISFPTSSEEVRRHPVPAGCHAWDITDHRTPAALDTSDGYLYTDNTGLFEAVVFNPTRTLLQIEPGYEEVVNQDFHAEAEEGAEYLIITTNSLKPYAERLARLHNEYDGWRSVIVTPEQAFNEFTSGTPDPMAFRLMGKMLFQSPGRKLKNIIFLGPIYSDYRNIRRVKQRPEGHLVYQELRSDLTQEDGMPPAPMEYYCAYTDYLSSPNKIQHAKLDAGIGLLDVTDGAQAEMMLNKIEAYLKKEDFSGLANEFMVYTCEGDSHIHDRQGIAWNAQYSLLHDEPLGSDLALRFVWEEGTTTGLSGQIMEGLNQGKLITTYFGHAGITDTHGLSLNEMKRMENREPGFFLLAGCSALAPEMGLHGVGDMGVLGTPNGFVGSLAATRSVMSNMNEDLMKYINKYLFQDRNDKMRTVSPTIGEVVAEAKRKLVNDSEIAYIYTGDPGLRVHVPLVPIHLKGDNTPARAGSLVTFSGSVLDADGEEDGSYNGFVTLKILAPVRYLYHDKTGFDTIPYRDDRLIAVKGMVKDGRFEISTPLPPRADLFLSTPDSIQTLRVLASTFDPDKKLAASGCTSLEMALINTEPDPESPSDTQAPSAEIEYDPALGVLKLYAQDDVALLPGIGAGRGAVLTIDGNLINILPEFGEEVGVREYSAKVSVAALSEGKHKAIFKATDLAGNSSETYTYQFTTTARTPLLLTADRHVALDEITFNVNAQGDYQLLLATADGTIAYTEDFSGNNYTADISNLPAGTYRACVRHNSERGAYVYSNWTEVNIID